MKGVILGICREARLVDLTHEVAPHDVLEGALFLESAWRFFPSGSIHLAVIDPGVGSRRKALGLRAGGHCFVGPDNGLFTFALAADGWSAVSIEAPAYRLPEVSRTFHGRDIFAPAAAHLASGVPLERLGPIIVDPVRLALPYFRREGDEVVGEVIGSDRFGNLLTYTGRHRGRTGRPRTRDYGQQLPGRSDGHPHAHHRLRWSARDLRQKRERSGDPGNRSRHPGEGQASATGSERPSATSKGRQDRPPWR